MYYKLRLFEKYLIMLKLGFNQNYMSLIFLSVYTAWLVSEIMLNKVMRGSNTDQQQKDKGSLTTMWIIIIVSTVAARFVSHTTPWKIDGQSIPFIGLLVIIAGMILRFAAIIQLGRLFTVMVTIREGHHLKKDGIYKHLRHPSYSGSLLSFLGYGISLNNWLSLAVVFVPILFVFVYRMNIEEKVLSAEFNGEYTDYMKTTKRLIPWIY